MTPKVSICIPAYLQTQFLKQTLDSVLEQEFDDYEIIITDDSPDDSVEKLVNEYNLESKLKYIKNPQQLGSPANWNRAVSLSSGEYIKILHHDDWLASPSSLGEFVEMLDSNPDSGFAFSGAIAKVATTTKSWHHFASNSQIKILRNDPTSLFSCNVIGPPSSTIIRRESFVEYDEKLVWIVDIAQFIRILCKTNFVASKKPLIVSTTQAPHQITSYCANNKRLNIFEHFYLFDSLRTSMPEASQKAPISKLIELIFTYNIRSIKEIRQTGYEGLIPEEVIESLKSPTIIRFLQQIKWKLSRRFNQLMP